MCRGEYFTEFKKFAFWKSFLVFNASGKSFSKLLYEENTSQLGNASQVGHVPNWETFPNWETTPY
jgi:hypothetical protein